MLSDRLTDREIEEALALAEKATPGRWWWHADEGGFMSSPFGMVFCAEGVEVPEPGIKIRQTNIDFMISASEHYKAALTDLLALRAKLKALAEEMEDENGEIVEALVAARIRNLLEGK
jgi:hypothetical protein